MPVDNKDLLPTINPGDPMRAADINKIVDVVRRLDLGPGSFSNGVVTVRRRLGTSGTTTAAAPTGLAPIQFGRAESDISAATDWDNGNWGEGSWQPYDNTGAPTGSPKTASNRYFNKFVEGQPIWCANISSTGELWVVLSVGCSPGP